MYGPWPEPAPPSHGYLPALLPLPSTFLTVAPRPLLPPDRIPIGSSGHGPGSNREEWGWDPEEDNVELLHPATATSSSTSTTVDGRPEPYSDRPKETNSARGNGIYSLVRANPLNGQQARPRACPCEYGMGLLLFWGVGGNVAAAIGTIWGEV